MKALKGVFRTVASQVEIIRSHRLGFTGVCILLLFILIMLLGPLIAPYSPWKPCYHNGKIESLQPPSFRHPMGTTLMGRDLFSQFVYGTRGTLSIGLLAGIVSIVIGMLIGLPAGYHGGLLDDLLMRFTDIIYGMPFLPFIIVLVSLLGRNLWFIVIAIFSVVWRTSARVIRSETLSLKEQQFVTVAKARGSGTLRIILLHIVPNILPLLLLYTAFNMAWAILAAAGASFLGFGDPEVITWGSILYQLWVSGKIRVAWWWMLFPSFSIVATVSAFIFISQAYEEEANPKLKER